MPQNLPLFPSKAASLGNNAPNQPLFPSEAAGGCVIMINMLTSRVKNIIPIYLYTVGNGRKVGSGVLYVPITSYILNMSHANLIILFI